MTATVTAETIARDVALVLAVLGKHDVTPGSLTYIRGRITVEVPDVDAANRLTRSLSLEPEGFATYGFSWRRGTVGGVNVSVRHPRPVTHFCAVADCTHGADS